MIHQWIYLTHVKKVIKRVYFLVTFDTCIMCQLIEVDTWCISSSEVIYVDKIEKYHNISYVWDVIVTKEWPE